MYNETMTSEDMPGNGFESGTQFQESISLAVRNIGIPPRPAILDEIEREMRKDAPDYKRLAQVVSADVALAASVIKVANSPALGIGKRVRTVTDALLVLGLKMTIQTIAGIVLQRIFPHVPSLVRFWDSAARMAHMARWLAKNHAGLNADDAYTYGLFRDCGIPVIMIPFPGYADILHRANHEREKIFTEIEDEMLGLNHATLGAEFAADWHLPEEIVIAIEHHHDSGFLAGFAGGDAPLDQACRLAAIGHLAEFLIQEQTGLSQDCEWQKHDKDVMSVLALTPEQIDQFLEKAAEVVSSGV